MRWRLLKLNWSYAISELLIVISGVLIALAVDQWNSNRLDRREEQEIVDRLIVDANRDLQALADQLQSLERKEASLFRVQSVLASDGSTPEDPAAFLRDIVIGANYGWNQWQARRITISELLATGKLGLIRDVVLRDKIGEYYESERDAHQRIDERETGYPTISYQLVSRANEGTVSGDSDIVELALHDDAIAQAVSRVLDSSLDEHVTAELNFARFVQAMTVRLQNTARELISALEDYRDRSE